MSRGRRLAIPLLFVAAPLLFYYEATLSGRAYLLRDLLSWFYPWREFAAQSLRQGEFPLWNPYAFTGAPFLANLQSGLLYPPNVLFWIFDFPVAMPLFLVVQSALAGWFMYRLVRGLECGVAPGATAAIGWAFSGWMVAHVEFPNKFAAAAWLPLLLHGMSLWRRGRTVRGLLAGSAASAACVTAGYPLTTFTVLLGAGVMWAILAIGDGIRARSAGEIAPFSARPALLLRLASLPAMLGLGALISAAQWVPFLEAFSIARLTGAGNPLKLGFDPAHFLALVYPHLFGLPGYTRYWGGDLLQFWLGHFYTGLATLVLAAVGLSGLRRGDEGVDPAHPERRLWGIAGAILAALAALFCMSDRTPLAPFLVAWIPGFGHFKWLTTASLLIVFPLCLLAAFGLQRIATARVRFPLHLALPSVPLAIAGLAAIAAPATFEAAIRWLVRETALPDQIPLIGPNLGIVRSDAAIAALMAVLLAATGLALWRYPARAGSIVLVIPALLFVDLFAAARGTLFAGDPSIFRTTPPLAKEIADDPDPLARIYVTEATLKQDLWLYGSEREEDFRWAARSLLFNLNLPHRIFSASDGDPMASARWRSFTRMLEASADDPDRYGRLLALAGVSRVIRGARGQTDVARVPATLPRAWVAASARRVEAGTALGTMLTPEWSPWAEALLEEDPPEGAPWSEPRRPGPDARPIEQTLHSLAHTANTVTVEIEARSDGWLVLGEAWYPGWRATVDGSPARVFLADHLFRAVPLTAGRHTVRFTYRPRSVAWGFAISGIGIAALAAAAIRRSGPSRPRRGPGRSPAAP